MRATPSALRQVRMIEIADADAPLAKQAAAANPGLLISARVACGCPPRAAKCWRSTRAGST